MNRESSGGSYQNIRSFGEQNGNNSVRPNRNSRDAKTFKLYVSGIPVLLDENEFQSIFSIIATTTSVYLAQPTAPNSRFKWGFVEFNSKSDAEAAIEMFDGKDPHRFSIKFAATPNKTSNNSKSTDNRNESRNNNRRSTNLSANRDCSSSSDINDIVDKPKEKMPRDGYHRSRPHYNQSLSKIKNIHVQVAGNGKKTVKAIFENRLLGGDSIGSCDSALNFSMNLVALGFCQVCGLDARKKCEPCGTAYCSERCAATDWKIHKTKCSVQLPKPNATSSPVSSKDVKLERLHSKDEKPNVNTNKSDQSHNRNNSDSHRHQQEKPHKLMNGESRSLNQKTLESQSIKSYKDNIMPIPADKFTKVLAMYVEEDSGNVWVVSEMQTAFSLNTQLQEYCSSSDAKPISKPCIGMLCAALFKEEIEWFRAEIIAIEPCLKVRCLDYGNEEEIPLDLLRILSPELSAVKPLAFKIKFAPEFSSLLKQLVVPAALSVKPIKMCDGECLVTVDDSTVKSTPVLNSDSPPVPKNKFSKVIISYASDKNVYWVQKICDLKASVDLLGRVNSFCKSSSPINPDDIKIGQIYGALFEELWYRGEILAVKPFIKVSFVDFGNEEVCAASDIKKLSEDLIALPPHAFKIELASGTADKYYGLLEEERLSIKPVSKSGNAWVVQIENESYPSNTSTKTEASSVPKFASVSTPAPSTPCCLLDTSFTKVTVMYAASETEYWVLKSSDFQSYMNLSTNVNKVCQSAQPINPPEIVKNSIYGAKFENAWYRALVMETKPAIKVRFIDYGNDEICSAKDMRKLTQELLAVPPYAMKISLAPGTSNKYHGLIDCDELSVKLISQEKDTLVVCVDDDTSSTAPPVAIVAEKAVQSKKPEVAATPAPAPNKDNSTLQQPAPLPMTTFTQVFVSVQAKSSAYWVFKGADMAQNNSILVELNKYCSSTEAQSLINFTVGSLCSAMYEGDWYRGKILSIEPEIMIRFIDYGNEEACSKESIKSLPPELATLPPLAFKISLAEGTSDKYHNLGFQSVLSVKPVKKIDGVWIVMVENEVYKESVTDSKTSDEKVLPSPATVNGSTSSTSISTPAIRNGVGSKSLSTNIFKQESPIPMDKFSSVAISYWCEPDVYWMYKPSEFSNMDAVITQTNDYCNSSKASQIKAPIPGLLCSALFEGEWYRAKIVSLEPEVKVFFIDFGNEEVCSLEDIRDIPHKLVAFPSLVFKVRLAEGTSQKHHNLPPGDSLKIRPISQCEDAWIVHVENDTYNKASPVKTVTFKTDSIENNARKEPKVTSEKTEKPTEKTEKPSSPVPTDSFTKVLVTFNDEGCTYWVNKFTDLNLVKKILEDLDAHCKNSQADKISNPTPGTLCSALYEGEWYRGLILSSKPALLIKFIDFGNNEICTDDDIRTLPQELCTIPHLAFQIKLADGTPSKYNDLPFQAEISIKPVSCANECWVVQVENEVYKNSVSASPISIPSLDNSKVKEGSTTMKVESKSSVSVQSNNVKTSPTEVNSLHMTIKKLSIDKAEPPIPRNTFTEVVIMHPINSSSYWVIPESQAFMSDRILTDLTKHCISSLSQNVTELKSNMKCAAKYGDDWCRAQVLSVNPLQVKFVDYGNVEEVSLSDIKVLPHELAKIKPLAFMIKMNESASGGKSKGFEIYSKIFIKPESRDKDGGWIVTVTDDSNESLENGAFNDSKISFKSDKTEEFQPLMSSFKSKPTNSADQLEDSFLPFNTFSSVNVVLCNGKDDYWVNLTSSMKSMLQMTTKLDSLSHEKVIPIVGKTYVTFYEDCWCRAKVVNLNPLKVFYIDYGNEDLIEASDLRPLPPEFINTPPFAFRIKLNEGTSEKYHNINNMETSISVQPISKTPCGTYIVEVEGEKTCKAVSKSSVEATELRTSYLSDHSISGDEGDVKHMLDVALKKCKCDLLVNRVWSNVHMSCSLLVPGKYAEQLTHIKQSIENLPLSQLYSGKVGSLVGCLDKDQVHGRGLVLNCGSSGSPSVVAMVDLGYTTEVQLLSPLPLALEQIPHASVSCRFKAPQNDVEVGSILKCSDLKSVGEVVKCQAYSRGECQLSVWKPKEQTSTLASVNVPSGTRVILSAISETCDIVYVQSMTEENIDNLRQTIRQTSNCAKNALQPSRGVEVGDVVACLFAEDNNYYRALILSEKNEKYSVRFLDFGNSCEATLNDFKILSDDIKKLPCCSVQVRLEGVRNTPVVPEIESIFNEHIDVQTVFTIRHKNLMNAKLTNLQNLCLNEELSKMTPCSPGTVSTSQIMLEHVKFVEWPVGVKLDLIILSRLSTNTFLMLNNKDPHLNDIRSDLTEKLSSYATANFPSDYTYKPAVNEVVLGLFHEDNQWYRAHCIKENVGDNYEIVFLDYGNIACVNSSHIRPITPEYLASPVIIRSCRIHGIPDQVTLETDTKLNSLFSEGSLHEVFVTKDTSQNCVSVYHPALVAKVNEKVIQLPPIHLPDTI